MRPIVYTATAADVANGATGPLPVNYLTASEPFFGLQYLQSNGSSAGTGTLQYSLDNPFTPPATGMTWTNITLTSGRASLNAVAFAFRVLTPVLGDVLTIVQAGGGPAG